MTEVCHDAGFEVINKDPMYVLLNDEDVLDNTNVFEDEPDVADDVLIDVAVDAIITALLLHHPLLHGDSIYLCLFCHSYIIKKLKELTWLGACQHSLFLYFEQLPRPAQTVPNSLKVFWVKTTLSRLFGPLFIQSMAA